MSTPIRKMRAHPQIMPSTAPKPITMLKMICQAAMVSVEAVILNIITNGMSGGVKLDTVAIIPFGCSDRTGHRASGMIKMIMIGPMRDCASRNSVTALPTAAIIDAIIK